MTKESDRRQEPKWLYEVKTTGSLLIIFGGTCFVVCQCVESVAGGMCLGSSIASVIVVSCTTGRILPWPRRHSATRGAVTSASTSVRATNNPNTEPRQRRSGWLPNDQRQEIQ